MYCMLLMYSIVNIVMTKNLVTKHILQVPNYRYLLLLLMV